MCITCGYCKCSVSLNGPVRLFAVMFFSRRSKLMVVVMLLKEMAASTGDLYARRNILPGPRTRCTVHHRRRPVTAVQCLPGPAQGSGRRQTQDPGRVGQLALLLAGARIPVRRARTLLGRASDAEAGNGVPRQPGRGDAGGGRRDPGEVGASRRPRLRERQLRRRQVPGCAAAAARRRRDSGWRARADVACLLRGGRGRRQGGHEDSADRRRRRHCRPTACRPRPAVRHLTHSVVQTAAPRVSLSTPSHRRD